MIWQRIRDLLEAIFLSKTAYMPHGNCYLWQTPLVGLHVTSDALIAIAYFSIPAMLVYFAYQRRQFLPTNIFLMFGAFISLCGIGHAIEIWTLWHPSYWLSGAEKALTALVSCYTAASLVTLVPQFLSLRTPEELEHINSQLQQEVQQRQAIAQELAEMNQTLEARIAERMLELQQSNALLRAEIAERQAIETAMGERLACAQLLSKTLQQVWTTSEFSMVLNTLADDVRQFLQVDRVLIYRLDDQWNGEIVVESVSDNDLSLLGQRFSDPCFQSKHAPLYQAGRIRAIDNIETSDLQDCHKDLLRRLNVRSNLILPILWEPEARVTVSTPEPLQLWGLLIIHACHELRPWKPLEIEILQQISIQLGIAIRQSQLVNCLQQELDQKTCAEIALQASEQEAQLKAQSLAQALDRLQEAQAQLVQSEKMASLWQVVGGLAHEINNPLSFIYGNLTHARRYSHELLQTIDLYQAHDPTPTESIREWFETFELEFVRDDFPKLLESMGVGANRIRDIILSLRNFSRLDESDFKSVNIHDGLNSALSLIANRLTGQSDRRSIQLTKHYDLDIPEVECYPGLLNQAIFNVINNALDALEHRFELDDAFEPSLHIQTQLINKQLLGRSPSTTSDFAQIRITDNGLGIQPQLEAKIFDPFFTTKPIGQGKGLGLSNAYQIIVSQHKGDLFYQLDSDGNTQFIINIPIALTSLKAPEPSVFEFKPSALYAREA